MNTSQDLPDHWDIADFTPAMPQFSVNPYPFYARLQADSPVHHVTDSDVWFITRYHDCLQILNDKRIRTSSSTAPDIVPPGYERVAEVSKHMLSSDPPDHTRMRSLVSKAFTPRAIEQLRNRVTSIVVALLNGIVPRGEMDLMNDFAFHLPAIVIAELLGVPHEDRATFKILSNAIIHSMGFDATPAQHQAGLDAQLALAVYFDERIDRRRGESADDLIIDLIQAEEQGDQLSKNEVVSTCILLLVAGHETTTNLIGNGTLSLLKHPEQMDLLRREPKLVSTAIEEMIRFESPVQRVARRTDEPLEINGTLIGPNQKIVTILAAANRDPSVFKEPERFDITRNPNPHIGFGRGIHFCLGAPLARLEAQVAFPLLLERLPNLRLANQSIVWNPSTVFRGLKSLPVTF